MHNLFRGKKLVVGVLVGTLCVGLLPIGVQAFTAGPAIRAGVATFPNGSGGITVTFAALPNSVLLSATTWTICNGNQSCPYVVVMGEAANAGGYQAGTPDCTYFNVLHKTQTSFEVQHKKCSDGSIVQLTDDVQLNWAIFKAASNFIK